MYEVFLGRIFSIAGAYLNFPRLCQLTSDKIIHSIFSRFIVFLPFSIEKCSDQ
jgi:hypothetical protein